MNYLNVPDSSLRLTDGCVVILDRFPGVKWIVHNGWYRYNDRQYMGWYFVSIPSQTVLPVNNQDLRMLTLVSDSQGDVAPSCPLPPAPQPAPHPCPPIYPPVPPHPEPERPAFFSKTDKKHLDAAFISVPTLKKRDELDTSSLPDGKIVRVNSVDGFPKYYAWSAFNDHWEELSWVSDSDIEAYLSNYYTSTQINEYIEALNEQISSVQTSTDSAISEMSSRMEQLETTTSEKLDEATQELQGLHEDIDHLQEEINEQAEEQGQAYLDLESRVAAVESAVFNIEQLPSISDANTILVSSEGTLKDSGTSLEETKPKWNSF